MNVLADESVDRPIYCRLRQDGHVVKAIAELSPGISDDEVLEIAIQENLFLITADKDFGELVFRQGKQHTGILLLRLSGLDEAGKSDLTSRAIADNENALHGAFSVLTEDSLRIRRPPPG